MRFQNERLMFAVILLAIVLSATQVYAQAEGSATANAFGIKESKSIDIYFGFEPDVSSGTWYNKTLNFTPVDRVDYMISANIRMIIEQIGQPLHSFLVNGSICNVGNISSSITRTQYVADFDCTNIINESGIYEIAYMSSLAVDNVHYRAYISWINDPDFITPMFKNRMLEGQLDLISNHDYCVNDTTLTKELTFEITVDNETTTASNLQNITCQWGCDSDRNECIPDPATRIIWVIGIIIFIIFVILLVKRFW